MTATRHLTPLRRGILALVLLAGAPLLAQSCNSHSVEPFSENIVAEKVEAVGSTAANKVDILWVVDNSGSMCEEQAQLRQNFNNFIDQIIEFGVDFNLAVITTDMMAADESGRFQNIPDGVPGPACTVQVDISSCPGVLGADTTRPENVNPAALPPLVIRSTDPRYRNEDGSLNAEKLRTEFACNATTGTRGNGFEMGLESVRTALSPALLETVNRDFLREDAYLAIIFLTDENDCSDNNQLNKTNGNVCEWERDRLVPPQDYIDAISALKTDPSRLILAGIIAPDNGVRYDTPQEVGFSCSSSLGTGYAGYRYESVINAFPANNISNICAEGAFSSALDAIGRLIVESLDSKCLADPPVTCDSNADCNGKACASRGGPQMFCEAFKIQVEITRPTANGPIAERECEDLKGTGNTRCILTEGADFTLNYADSNCGASGISVNLTYQLQSGDKLGVRYPRAIELD